MAVPVLVSSQVPAGDTVKRFFDLQAKAPLRIPRLVGLGDARCIVTTDQAATGAIATSLTSMFAAQVAATGLVLFPPDSITIVTMRAAGRRTAASIAQYIERRAAVITNGSTIVSVTNSTGTSDVIMTFGGDTPVVCSFTLSSQDVVLNLGGGNASGVANWVIDVNIGDPIGVPAGS